MKKLLNDLILQNEAMIEFLETKGRNFKEADDTIPLFNDFLVRSKFNAVLALDYLNLLQCANEESVTESFELTDISKAYDNILKTQEYNLEAYTDAAHFEYSVMNNNAEARKIAVAGINNAQEKIEELQKLLHQISKSGHD